LTFVSPARRKNLDGASIFTGRRLRRRVAAAMLAT
jgi:hypothetical protein